MSYYDRLASALLRGDEITSLPPVQPLIDGILDLDNIGETYGRYGAGKSFLVLDWALCVASGKEWWGHKVQRGKVLYVVGEGVIGTGPRYRAWCEYHDKPDLGSNMLWAPFAPNLLSRDERGALLQIVAEEMPVFTILDTLARHLPGGDENVSPVMSAMVETLDEIKRITGGHAHVVHHPGKAEDAKSRGHTSLPGALDTQLEVVGTRNGDGKGLILKVEKQKNHEDGQMIARLKLVPVATSCVLVLDQSGHPMIDKIVAFLGGNPGASKRELRGLGNSVTIDRELGEMVRLGTVILESDDKPGTPHRYFLP